MSKKLTFLFIATFILALVFFSSYFVVQEVRGTSGVINIGNNIDMVSSKVENLRSPYDSPVGVAEPITKKYLEECLEQICFWQDTELRALQGLGPYCVRNWCEINDFEWCTEIFDPPGYGSFTAETQILMAENSYKPIKEVKEGDWILTKESESSDKMVSAKVAKTFERTANSYLIINNELKATDLHPIFVIHLFLIIYHLFFVNN